MADRIGMSANAERVINPRTFISTKPGLRRRVCVARSSLRLPRAAVKRPCFRRGFVSGAQRRLQITSNGNHAQRGRFIIATIRGSKLLQGRDGVIVGSHSGSSGAPRAVHGVFRVRNLVGGPRFDPGASRSRTVVMSCPPVTRGSSSVRSYLIAVCFVSFRVLLDPPGSGILCPGCAPAVPRRWSTDRSKADPFPWQRTKTRWCRPQRRYGQHGRESVQRGDVGLCPASEEVVFASQSVAVNHTLSSRKGDTALPYRPHSFTR